MTKNQVADTRNKRYPNRNNKVSKKYSTQLTSWRNKTWVLFKGSSRLKTTNLTLLSCRQINLWKWGIWEINNRWKCSKTDRCSILKKGRRRILWVDKYNMRLNKEGISILVYKLTMALALSKETPTLFKLTRLKCLNQKNNKRNPTCWMSK